jgi:hypothetical protein
MATLQPGDAGAMQLISPILFMQALNRRPEVNNDELEKRLREYIDSKFTNLEKPDFDKIKGDIKKEIKDTLPSLLNDKDFQTKEAFEVYIKSLNFILREEFEKKMSELDKADVSNSAAIIAINERISNLEAQFGKLRNSAEVDQAIASIASIRAQIGNTKINELNIPGLTAKVNSLESQINTLVPEFREETKRLSASYTDLNALYKTLIKEQDERNTVYDVISGEMEEIQKRLRALESMDHVEPNKYKQHKAYIETQMVELKESIKLIQSMQQDIDSIRRDLDDLKDTTIPAIGIKLEERLTALETKMSQVDITSLNGIKAELNSIQLKFNKQLDLFRYEIKEKITEELKKLPSEEDFIKLKELVTAFQMLSPASFKQLKKTLDEISSIRAQIDRLNRIPSNNQDLKNELTAKINADKITIMETITLLTKELEQLKQSKTNKYLKGGNQGYGSRTDQSEFILTETPTY